jgi:hypothetical protein
MAATAGWERPVVVADSDESVHLFQSISDSVPGYSDDCRSEATLCVHFCHRAVENRPVAGTSKPATPGDLIRIRFRISNKGFLSIYSGVCDRKVT